MDFQLYFNTPHAYWEVETLLLVVSELSQQFRIKIPTNIVELIIIYIRLFPF